MLAPVRGNLRKQNLEYWKFLSTKSSGSREIGFTAEGRQVRFSYPHIHLVKILGGQGTCQYFQAQYFIILHVFQFWERAQVPFTGCPRSRQDAERNISREIFETIIIFLQPETHDHDANKCDLQKRQEVSFSPSYNKEIRRSNGIYGMFPASHITGTNEGSTTNFSSS